MNLPPDQYFFHYTTRDAAFGGILPSRKLRLSTYGAMRDPLETQNWRFTFTGQGPRDDAALAADLAEQTEFERRANLETRDRSHLLSLTIDAEPKPGGEQVPFCRGWSRARMWEQYSERHRGVCLVFDRSLLTARFVAEFERANVSSLFHRPVIYEGGGVLKPVIAQDAFREDPDFFTKYVEANSGALFFTKMLDWETEHEYRFVAIAADSSPLAVDFGESLAYVIAGEQLPRWEYPAVIEACRSAGADPLLLRWNHWRPGLTELPVAARPGVGDVS